MDNPSLLIVTSPIAAVITPAKHGRIFLIYIATEYLEHKDEWNLVTSQYWWQCNYASNTPYLHVKTILWLGLVVLFTETRLCAPSTSTFERLYISVILRTQSSRLLTIAQARRTPADLCTQHGRFLTLAHASRFVQTKEVSNACNANRFTVKLNVRNFNNNSFR